MAIRLSYSSLLHSPRSVGEAIETYAAISWTGFTAHWLALGCKFSNMGRPTRRRRAQRMAPLRPLSHLLARCMLGD